MKRLILIVSLLVLVFSQGSVAQTEVIYEEDFSTAANYQTELVKPSFPSSSDVVSLLRKIRQNYRHASRSERQQMLQELQDLLAKLREGQVFKFYERYLTWSLVNDLGPGSYASSIGSTTPASFQGTEGNYFVGQLIDSTGSLILNPIDTAKYTDLTLTIRMAAAAEGNTLERQNNFEADDFLNIYIDDIIIGAYAGGYQSDSSALRSAERNEVIATNFTDYTFAVDDAAQIQIKIDAKNSLREFIGIDNIRLEGVLKDLCPNDPEKTDPGICGCGVPDTDSDGDGTANCKDACAADPNKVAEGICGCGVADTDTDGDGTADCNDGCVSDPLKTEVGQCGCGVVDTDTDGDGVADCIDGCKDDANKVDPMICGCGTADTDSDGDLTPDCIDGCPADAGKTTAGVCGCGVADSDSDGDGTPDCNDTCPSDPTKTAPGVCGCGTADTDTDSDGTPDCNDQCPSDAGKTAPGTCGCGVADTDSDNDGVLDCNDVCPTDPAKTTSAGVCGCGIPDSTPNCLFNGDFQTGDLTNWTPNGAVTVIEYAPGEFAGDLLASSAVSLTIKTNTPAEFFFLLFDTKFLATNGTLTVQIFDPVANAFVTVGTLNAPTTADTGFNTQQLTITNPALFGLSMTDLRFTYEATSGSELMLDNVVVVPGSASNECIYIGDPIGPDSSSTDGNGGSTAIADFTVSGTGFDWGSNLGDPAILYTSDGKGLLGTLRAIVTLIQRTSDGVHWDRAQWVVDVWEKPTYLAKGQPIITVDLGNHPDNWTGFQTISSTLVIPDTTPFGYPAGIGSSIRDYEMIFNLQNYIPFQTPLPAGEYIIGYRAVNSPDSDGEPFIMQSYNGAGPVIYYSATGFALSDPKHVEPQPVYPNLFSDPNARFAMSVTQLKLSCN